MKHANKAVPLLLLAAILLQPSFTVASSLHRFDRFFEFYALRHAPQRDWKHLKAQCYQESRLNPTAVSPAGAQGLCQFMPGTWRDMQDRYGIAQGAFNPVASIRAASLYMRDLEQQWRSPRPDEDRYNLALASYNAGLGNLLRAQKKCNDATFYKEIIECLPQVTGRHSEETIGYVISIWGHYHDFVSKD